MELIRYSAARLATMIATVVVGCIVVFLVMKAAPGDPALSILGDSANPELVAAFRLKHNLDAPVLVHQITATLPARIVSTWQRGNRREPS